MKGLFETLRNIYKIDDLRVRILNTLGFILVYRLGSYVILPGVDPVALDQANQGAQGGLTELLNMFAGGAFSRASICALGIMPYISASIVIQLLGMAIPYFQKLQKEGESGRRKINQITRLLTIFITPAAFTFKGMYCRTPPYCLLPTILFANCTGTLLLPCTNNMVTTITIIRKTISTRNMTKPPPCSSNREKNSEAKAKGRLAIIPIMISKDIPLPTPLSVIFSPNHITKNVPVVRMSTVVILKKEPPPSIIAVLGICVAI